MVLNAEIVRIPGKRPSLVCPAPASHVGAAFAKMSGAIRDLSVKENSVRFVPQACFREETGRIKADPFIAHSEPPVSLPESVFDEKYAL